MSERTPRVCMHVRQRVGYIWTLAAAVAAVPRWVRINSMGDPIQQWDLRQMFDAALEVLTRSHKRMP